MATEDHLELASYIKGIHKQLRERTKEIGAEMAWDQHLNDKQQLDKYAHSMKNLATMWNQNFQANQSKHNDRTLWCAEFCRQYFQHSSIVLYQRQRELNVLKENNYKLETIIEDSPIMDGKIKLLDVGSCYDAFRVYEDFDVTSIDIAPATSTVLQCDFLSVSLSDKMMVDHINVVHSLSERSYNVVIFSLLLEYFPISSQRKKCCEKAYNLLGDEGLLLIITPDSKHIGANAKLMKNWRYTLATMGFNRIKYEKLDHITCMAFRKCLSKAVSLRWAQLHKEPYMDEEVSIPQDFYKEQTNYSSSDRESFNEVDTQYLFQELPNL